METQTPPRHLPLSDLLHHHHPIAATSFLPNHHHHPKHTHTQTPHASKPKNPNTPLFLKPLTSPSFLSGTITLNSNSSSCTNSSCLTFNDHNTRICCDILDFDLAVFGQKIKILAWNFLPVKPHGPGGFLEIIRWKFQEPEVVLVSKYNGFYLNNVNPVNEENVVPRHLVYGLVESVSPVTNVPCSGSKSGTKNLNGFLAEVVVCECGVCSCKDRVMLFKDVIGYNGHSFTKSKVVYFCGDASVWYGGVSRMVGRVVVMSGLKKKMVFLGEGKSVMMYMTVEKSVIHLTECKSRGAVSGGTSRVERKGVCSVYTGSVTEVYMQGMVVELDEKVLLLLTDLQLSMPHSLRVGAIVTVRNFHIEHPKFAWTKLVIFGSCYKTSVRINVFSPIESGCYQALQSRSLLRKFIESLTFSARLWVLLVVSSMRKKFAGAISEMEILGSKHMEGLVQKYCSSCLPLSVFQFRHGVLSEYCLHDVYGCGKEVDYNPPKLVVPISNLISQCEDMFIKGLNASGTDSDKNQYSSIICGGISHDQPIRKILKSEDMNVVLLASLKISEYSGRLHLNDATGSIDAVIPDLPSVWSIKDIYEINDFTVVIEGFPRQLEHSELLNNEPFSCGNIFNHFHLSGKKRFTIYIHCCMKDAKLRNHILCPSLDMEAIFKDLEDGRFHLLSLVHKFPVQQKFPGDRAVSKNSSIYAEAIVLPWNLTLYKREIDSVESSDPYNEKQCDLSCVKELPCTIDCRSFGDKSMVSLSNCTIAKMQEDSSCRRTPRKLLMEFNSDSFRKYEALRIGGYYLIKHYDKDMVCTAKDGKVLVNSTSHLWSVSFSADDHNLNVIHKEVQPPNSGQVEIPVLKSMDGCPEISSDIYLRLTASHLSFLEVKLRELKEDLIQPTNLIKGLLNSSSSLRTMMSASMSPGDFGVNLPMGNLLSVQGHVVAVHSSGQSHLVNRLTRQIFQGALRHIVPGLTNGLCIHVLVEHNIVKIYSSLGEHSYPIGFGPGVKAKFHRVLVTAEGDLLKLTPASFIEINSIVVDNDQFSNESGDTPVKSVVETATSLTTGPAALISEIMHFSYQRQMRFLCRVVTIYLLVVEKNNELLQSFTTVNSEMPHVKFPLAGFIMDDGSSSCCFWTDNERVVTLLGLHELSTLKHSRSLHRSEHKKKEIPLTFTMSQISKISDRHGTVVMKNHGSVSDSSCLDVAISLNSGSVVSQSDEQFLKFLILQACSSNSWNVVGTVLDSKAVNQLEERLQKLGMMMPPLQNIWASEISHVDTLNEGRSILQELLASK